MSDSDAERSSIARPEDVLPPGDGDETLQRYTYQIICAAQEALLLLDDAVGLDCIFCELHEDILVKKNDGTYMGVQVKTKGAGAFRADDSEITHAIGRFIRTEKQFPDLFFGYTLATNATFEKGQKDRLWQDISTLIVEAKASAAADLSDAPSLKKWYQLYYKEAGDEIFARKVFAKLTVKLQAALEHAALRLAAHIGGLPGMDTFGMPVLNQLTEALLQTVQKASIRTIDESKIARLNYLPEPQKAYEQAVLDGKRITAGMIRAVFEKVTDSARLAGSHQPGSRDLADIKEMLSGQTKLVEQLVNGSLPRGNTVDVKFGGQIDTLKAIIEEGKPSFALGKLEEIRKEAERESASEDTFFRLAINIGVCYFRTDDLDKAIAEFDRALKYRPNSVLALSNKAQALLSQKNPSAALTTAKLAIEQERSEISCAAYLAALSDMNDHANFDKFVKDNPQVEMWPACLSVIAESKMRQGEFNVAYDTLTEALELESSNPQLQTQIAQVIHLQLDKELRSVSDVHLLPAQLEKLREMLRHLNEAVKVVSKFDNQDPYVRALCNRSFVKSLLDDESGALVDMETALQIEPKNVDVLRTKGMILFKQKKWRDAVLTLTEARSLGAVKTELALASCFLALKQFKAAKETILPALNNAGTDVRELIMLDVLASAHRGLEEFQAVEDIIGEMKTRWTDSADASYMIARQFEQDGKSAQAKDFLITEIQKSTEQTSKDLLRFRLAEIYYNSGDFNNAAKTFDLITDHALLAGSLGLRITTFANIGRYDQAYGLAKELRDGGPVIPVISDIEATIAAFIGDFDSAAKLYQELCQVEPTNIKHLLRLIQIKARAHQFDQAKQLLHQIPEDLVRDGGVFCEIAAIYSYLCEPEKCLEYTYLALQSSPHDPRIQTFFVSSLLRVSPSHAMLHTPERVTVGTCVKLKPNALANELEFVILSANEKVTDRYEVRESDSLARLLVGKKVGDQIILREDTPEQIIYTIAELKTRYVAAFQRILTEFPTRFPDSKAIETITVEREARLMAAVDQQHKFGTRLIAAYESGLCTLAQLSEHLRQPEALVFLALFDSEAKIVAADGSIESQNAEVSIIKTAEKLVLDLTALLAAARLNLLDLIGNGFKDRILVPTAVLDELLMIRDDEAFGSRKHMYVGKAGEAYRITELGDETLKQRHAILSQIKVFLENHARLTYSQFGLEDSREEIELKRDTLGWSTYAAAQIARETNAVMYCDDWKPRQYAEQTWGIQTMWTRGVLQRLREDTIINEDQLRQAIYQMALYNYWFLPLSVEDLFFALKANEFSINKNVVFVFEKLQDADVQEGPLVAVISELLKQVWLQVPVEEKRLWILDLCVKVLTLKHPKGIIKVLMSELERKLWLMPLALNSIKQNIFLISRENPL